VKQYDILADEAKLGIKTPGKIDEGFPVIKTDMGPVSCIVPVSKRTGIVNQFGH
jgi:hypothetical protein